MIKTLDYIQIASFIDQTQINLTPDDYGGELNPHGANFVRTRLADMWDWLTQLYSMATRSVASCAQTLSPEATGTTTLTSKSSTGPSESCPPVYHVRLSSSCSFMGGHTFRIKVCDPTGKNAPMYCQNIYDHLGCAYNAPNNAKNGTFEVCKGDNMTPPGVYVSGGVTQTYFQPPESLGPITTVPYTPAVPSSSNCVQYSSAALYTALPKSTSAPSRSGGSSASGTHSGAAGPKATPVNVPIIALPPEQVDVDGCHHYCER